MANLSGNLAQFPKGFSGGLSIQGVPLFPTFATSAGPANSSNSGVYWVDSVNGKDGNPGTYNLPLATVSRAFALVKAKDIVMVAPNHTESIIAAGGWTLSTAGVSVIGVGNERSRPTITLSTAATATFLISGANTLVQGFRFVHGVASLVTVLDVQATGVTVAGNEFVDGAATTGFSDIDVSAVSVTANAADGLKVYNNRFWHPTAGNMKHAVGLNLVEDYVEISGNLIYGNFSLSGIHNVTGKVATNLNVNNNEVKNLTAGKSAMNLVSACTGTCYGNHFIGGDQTVADAVYGSLTVGNGNFDSYGPCDQGSMIVRKKTITSSTITTGAQTLLTATGGDVHLENVILKTNSTGLAGGTNFQLGTNSLSGLAVFLAEAVANLGANKTVDLFTASVTKQRASIESTKVLNFSNTVGAGTGAGTIDVVVIAYRGAAGATLIG